MIKLNFDGMSGLIEFRKNVMHEKDLTPMARLLAIKLIDDAISDENKRFRVYPLADELGVSVNLIYTRIRELEKFGILKADLKHKNAELQNAKKYSNKGG